MTAGETAKDPSPWTIDSVMAHLLAIMDERDRRYQQRFESTEEAVLKKELDTDKRFAAVNEFRGQQSDIVSTFIPRVEANAKFTGINEKIDSLSSRLDKAEGAVAGAANRQAALIAVSLFLFAAISFAVNIINK